MRRKARGTLRPAVHMSSVPGIPFYRQTYDFTCGPACLIMAMRRYRPSLKGSSALELDIWRESNLVEAYATSRQGLALAAYRRGFRVRTQGNAESIELIDCLGLHLSPETRAVAAKLHRELKRRCREAGIRDVTRSVRLSDLARWVGRGWTPIVLVDALLVVRERLPHWIVVTGIDSGSVTFHDPLARKGPTAVKRSDLRRWLGFRGTECVVVVIGEHPSSAGAVQ